MKYKVGDTVQKIKGYDYIGTVVSVFNKTNGDIRLVVEEHKTGMLHIFNESTLKEIHINYLHCDCCGEVKTIITKP